MPTQPSDNNIHSTVFVSEIETQNRGWQTVGFVNSDGKKVPPEYLVTITSIRNQCSVVSILQEPIQMDVESRWKPFIPTQLLDNGNTMVQMFTGGRKSLVTKACSRRLWEGSTPITLSLMLRFEAVKNTQIEVVEACKILQKMSLPSERSNSSNDNTLLEDVISNVPTLIPPGPTPFTLSGILDLRSTSGQNSGTRFNKIKEGMGGGDVIIIEIGRFLTFYNVILNKVGVSIPPTMSNDGNPISATANVVFETYEMTTTEELDKMYTKGILSAS